MNKLFGLSFAIVALLSGCKLFNSNNVEEQPLPVQEQPTEIEKLPPAPFTKNSLSALLTAEFAERRGHFDLTLQNYVEQANKTKDPKVIERAYQIAEYLDANNELLNIALLWVSVAPDNIEANRAAAIQLAKNNRAKEAAPHLEKLLTQTTQLDFLNLAANNLTQQARENIILSLNPLLIKLPQNSQLIYSKSILLTQNGQAEQALTVLNTLPQASKQPAEAIILNVHLLQNLGQTDEALTLLSEDIEAHPNNKNLRLNYAQLLISQGKLTEAKQQFSLLTQQFPEDDELRFGLALICMENKDWDEAIDYLNQIISHNIQSDAVFYYLGAAYDEKGEKDLALQNYRLITGGDNFLPAVINSVKILFDKQQTKEAQSLLANTRQSQPEHAVALYLIEVEELSNRAQLSNAWQVINHALKENNNNISLLYSRALLAEKRNDLVQTEQDLRKIIKLEPENSSAINALGYILADKTTRYQEALTLIKQALKLNPDDPAALDSLGWVNYRLGNLTAAATYLQQAYEKYPDPEVASHLGEVLWTQGKHEEAKTVWKQALVDNPSNQTLKNTILRLTGIKEL